MIVMTGNKKNASQKYYKGKLCPDPIKGRRCKLCGKEYVCLARPKEKK